MRAASPAHGDGGRYTIGLDIDDDALEVAQENAREFELEDQMDFVRCNVAELLPSQFAHKVDTVIMNPPFGTKIKGIDMVFLEKALHVRHSALPILQPIPGRPGVRPSTMGCPTMPR